MSRVKLSNISVRKFRKFLQISGLKLIKSNKGRGGHEKWIRKDLDRPVIIQNHIDPVPEFIVKQILRHLNMSKQEFWNIYKDL